MPKWDGPFQNKKIYGLQVLLFSSLLIDVNFDLGLGFHIFISIENCAQRIKHDKFFN